MTLSSSLFCHLIMVIFGTVPTAGGISANEMCSAHCALANRQQRRCWQQVGVCEICRASPAFLPFCIRHWFARECNYTSLLAIDNHLIAGAPCASSKVHRTISHEQKWLLWYRSAVAMGFHDHIRFGFQFIHFAATLHFWCARGCLRVYFPEIPIYFQKISSNFNVILRHFKIRKKHLNDSPKKVIWFNDTKKWTAHHKSCDEWALSFFPRKIKTN